MVEYKKMEPISVVIITLNEAQNIGRCIDSVQQIASEVIVLDSFSTDETAKIAREKGAKFFQHAFDGHIEQKNRALSHANYEWVLSLDADEALSEEAVQHIKQKSDWNSYTSFSFNRLNNYCGQWIYHGGWYPDRKVRLFKHAEGMWKGANPHDKFETNRENSTGHIDADILHYSYTTREAHIRQSKNFAHIAAKSMYTSGVNKSWIKLFFSPTAKFFRDYFLRLGILDGVNGFSIAWISAKAVYWKYQALHQINRNA